MFALSQSTADALLRLIADRPGGGAHGANSANSSRQITYVSCESWGSSQGTCTVQEYNSNLSLWTTFGAPADSILLSADASPLKPGQRYIAVRYGASGSGQAVFVALQSTNTAVVKCGGWARSPDGCLNLYYGTIQHLNPLTWTVSSPATPIYLTDLHCGVLVAGQDYLALGVGLSSDNYNVFVTVGDSQHASSASASAGSIAEVKVVTDTVCNSGLVVTKKTLTGTVTVMGRTYPVSFAVS